MNINEIPIVKVFRTSNGMQYSFWCPFCNMIHSHGAVSLWHRIAHCTNQNSPYIFSGYIMKEYTQKELRKLGLPTDHYSKYKRKKL